MMKKLIIIAATFYQVGFTFCQTSVGIGTSSPAAPLDVASLNNWNLSSSEGDVRIGNNSYRLKFGLATSGGGAGAANIMQYGLANGYNVLSLGSQGKQVLFINGTTGNAGINTSLPSTALQVAGTTTTSHLILDGTGNGNSNDFLIKSNNSGLVAARKGHGALGINYIICVTGGDISDNEGPVQTEQALIGEIKMYAGTEAPAGWMFCHGQMMALAQNTLLFSILGTSYGGNGQTSFALPDLRGSTPVSAGNPPTGNSWGLGERTN